MKLFNKFTWYLRWDAFKAFFNPRQKWLTKHIPNTWKDKPELVQDILFACLIHFVEEEKGLHDESFYKKDLDDGYISQQYYEDAIAWNNDLREVHHYITKERPILETELEETVEPRDWIVVLDKQHDKDIWAMSTIVKYSRYLWT